MTARHPLVAKMGSCLSCAVAPVLCLLWTQSDPPAKIPSSPGVTTTPPPTHIYLTAPPCEGAAQPPSQPVPTPLPQHFPAQDKWA